MKCGGLPTGRWADFFGIPAFSRVGIFGSTGLIFFRNVMDCLMHRGLNSVGFLLEFYMLVIVMWSNPISVGFRSDFWVCLLECGLISLGFLPV